MTIKSLVLKRDEKELIPKPDLGKVDDERTVRSLVFHTKEDEVEFDIIKKNGERCVGKNVRPGERYVDKYMR